MQRGRVTRSLTAHTDPGYRRVERLMSVLTGDEKHSAAATSTLDVLWVLYDRVLAVHPATRDDPGCAALAHGQPGPARPRRPALVGAQTLNICTNRCPDRHCRWADG